ncbi:hypothetical protein GQ44DRAFT_744505 [Phaeosphaeriaceae sp. PMI808]|nr:hypothetical protein GQ44DRAFT_744505 [Phaeosphaeriaceae sp. PMI808]
MPSRECWFQNRWTDTIQQCEKSLDHDDQEQVRVLRSWEVVQKDLLEAPVVGPGRPIPRGIAFIKPTLGHLHQFTCIFESQLAPGLRADFRWGVIGLLLQVWKLAARDTKAKSHIPRMLKSLCHKAEAFVGYYDNSQETSDQFKEVYFEIQVRLLEFFTNAIKTVCGEEDDTTVAYGQQDSPWSVLQRRFVATNQDLAEAVMRVEKLAAARSIDPGRQSSSDIAALTQQFRCMILPTKKASRYFNRVDIFDKLDQALGEETSSSFTFRSVTMFGLGDTLRHYWPDAGHGKAIITTRNANLAYELGKSGSEFLLFLLKQNIGSDIQAETLSATELSKKLSGHALGISHMAGLIQRRSFSVTEFMRIYLKNPRKAHQSELQALWEYSTVVPSLVSENISQFFFDVDEDDDLPEDLEFCTDEFSFSEAIEPLLTLALIKRDRDARVFSCHRMVQTQFRFFLKQDERQEAFDNAVALDHFKQELRLSKSFKASPRLYLYEINALTDLDDVCAINLVAAKTLDDRELAIDIIASTLSHQASMYESIGKVQKAIKLNTEGYNMRLQEVPLKGGLLGGFEQNLAYNYNTANQNETALLWSEKSRATWTAWNVKGRRPADWPTVTKKNTARCLVHLGRLDDAQELLDTVVGEFRQEKPLNWAMLAYTYFVLGLLAQRRKQPEAEEANFMEAQNLWFKGDQTRLHPFNAGCVYKTGIVCLDQGEVDAAIKHLHDALEITKFHADVMPVEHARGLFKLSEALLQDSNDNEEANDVRDEAEAYLLRKDPSTVSFATEEDYDQWVPIF